MAKKVLIFSTNYFPYIGGAEVAIKEITDRISESDLSFDMVVPRYSKNNAKEERIGNINVYRVGLGITFDKFLIPFYGLKKAVSLNKERNYSLIWVMMASQASIAGARFKKRFQDKKLVLTLQEGDEEEYLNRYVFGSDFLYKLLIKPFYMMVFKTADQITVISNYLKERAERNSPNTPIVLIPNGVEMKRFFIDKDMALVSELGIEGDKKIVITTSRLVEKNGITDLVKSAEYFDENLVLVIVGDGDERKKLEKIAGSNVIFVGSVSQEDVPRYLSVADVFVRPSLSEGQGISFLEAMAAGVPVVATPVGGIVDFLKDGETGLFCEVNNPKSIAEKVHLFSRNEDLSRAVTTNARRMVDTEYSWDNIAKDIKERVFLV